MKPLVKKIFLNFIKGITLLFLLTMLVLEAFLTAPFVKADIIVVYTAIITTLCWLLLGVAFGRLSKGLYIFLAIVAGAYFYFYYFNSEIHLAHEQERCLDLGKVWDSEQKVCRENQ